MSKKEKRIDLQQNQQKWHEMEVKNMQQQVGVMLKAAEGLFLANDDMKEISISHLDATVRLVRQVRHNE